MPVARHSSLAAAPTPHTQRLDARCAVAQSAPARAEHCRPQAGTGVVKNRLLPIRQGAQATVHLTHLAQKIQIEGQFLIIARTEIIEQFVHQHEQALVEVLPVVVVALFFSRRQGKAHVHIAEMTLQLSADDVS